MKLRQISEGHWTSAPGEYPNSTLDSIPVAKEGKPKRHSPLIHPDDRERFIKWGHHGTAQVQAD
jgi:hypothetical protein